MAPALALVRLGLVGEAVDLGALGLADDLGRDRGAPSWSGVGEHGVAVDEQDGRSSTSASGSTPSRSTSSRWPGSTRYCLPPVWMTAYMTDYEDPRSGHWTETATKGREPGILVEVGEQASRR